MCTHSQWGAVFFPKEREEGIHWLRWPRWFEKHSLLHLGFAATSFAGIWPVRSNVGTTIINHPPVFTIDSWYGYHSHMGGLWHCYTHIKLAISRSRGDFCLFSPGKQDGSVVGDPHVRGSSRWALMPWVPPLAIGDGNHGPFRYRWLNSIWYRWIFSQ